MNSPTDPFGIVGQVLDSQFRVDRLVGEGGFSAVYRGHHLGLDEPIAIKCLKLPPALGPQLVDQFVSRFRDESRILYRLSQGNLHVVRSIAAGTWTVPATQLVVPFMVLEWLEGRSLANDFTVRRTLGNEGRSLDEIVHLFASAADALAFAHAQGVVHRDLNPGNFFLASTAQGVKLKVLDFGVAKIMHDSTLNLGPRAQTLGQIRIFAPAYGAPEQFDDAVGQVGTASDVYSFALVLLEAMRDRAVNEGTNLAEFAHRAVDPKSRPTPRSLGVDVPDEVERALARATLLDPRERWQTAGELWKAFTIAVNVASERKHEQAARETPSLGMPGPSTRTQQGLGVHVQKTQGTARMDRTMPLGAVLPSIPRPGAARPSTPKTPIPPRAPSAPNLPAAPAAPTRTSDRPEPRTERFGGAGSVPKLAAMPGIEADSDEMPTRVGALPSLDPMGESEDEVTRVRAPEPDVLRELVEAKLRGAPTPPPAAGAAPPAPEATPRPPARPEPTPPSLGGTLMMAPAHPQPRVEAPPQNAKAGPLAMTMPLTGPAPVAGGHAPHQAPPPTQGPQSAMQAPPPPQAMLPTPIQPIPVGLVKQMSATPAQSFVPPPPQTAQPRPSMEYPMPPSQAAPQPPMSRNTTLIFAGIAGAMLLVGLLGIGAKLVFGRRAPSAPSAPSASLSVAPTDSAPPPPLPATTAPPPVMPDEAEDSGAPASGLDAAPEAAAIAEPAPTTTAEPTPTATAVWPPTPEVKDAGAQDPNAWNEPLARQRLSQANGVLVICKKGGPTGPGTASVTFANDGSVSNVVLDPPYAGTKDGECAAGQFRRQKVAPFEGSPRTIKHSFEIPD